MKKNIGTADKGIRILIAVIAALLYFGNVISGIYGYVALAVGIVMLLTALVNFCPLYALLGVRSCKVK